MQSVYIKSKCFAKKTEEYVSWPIRQMKGILDRHILMLRCLEIFCYRSMKSPQSAYIWAQESYNTPGKNGSDDNQCINAYQTWQPDILTLCSSNVAHWTVCTYAVIIKLGRAQYL